MNINAYGGYYSSKEFSQTKADYKKNRDLSSSIGSDEIEAVLKEKDPKLLNELKGLSSQYWNKQPGATGFSAAYKKAAEYVYEARKEMGVDFSETTKTDNISSKNEDKLSQKAQDFLKNLRAKYGDYDFMVGNSTDDLRSLSKSGSKEFSVIFSNAELERMANDEKYAAEKMQGVEGAVKMCKRICEENGYVSAFGNGKGENGTINKIGVSVDDNGNMKMFAELEKTTSKQRERIEKNREKKAEEMKKKEQTAKKNPYEKEEKDSVKRTTIEAAFEDELVQKIKDFDWRKVSDSHSGDRFNFMA